MKYAVTILQKRLNELLDDRKTIVGNLKGKKFPPKSAYKREMTEALKETSSWIADLRKAKTLIKLVIEQEKRK